ncbi:MAG: beta-ketoacyl-[acyl-carrier-protein] synthase family protein [Fulvivirga sp.]
MKKIKNKPMPSKVYISGYGIVSSLGFNVPDNLHALKAELTGIHLPSQLQTLHTTVPLGEVSKSNAELAAKAGVGDQGLSRTSLLGIIAAKEAVMAAELTPELLLNAAVINGTSVGGMDISELAFQDALQGKEMDYQAVFGGHDCGYSTQKIAESLGIKGYLETISTACSSSANSIMNAGRMIKAGLADIVIAGGTDALSLFTLNGFNALKILDHTHCKPFDEERRGLNLGEGAAYLVLESERSLKQRKGEPLAMLTGYGNANDAWHQTASSPEGKGALLAMRKALEVAKQPSSAIDYINAHGTGTANNDLSESHALQKFFGNDVPPYSSTKAYTGHTLGAAGAIEAVFSMLSLQHQVAFPTLNLERPMTIIRPPLTKVTDITINQLLSNSFGFGGNCTSLLFSKAS